MRIVTLPFPRPVLMDGVRLPASYTNFYIGNGVVLVPTFNDPNDRIALNTIADLMPAHRVVGMVSPAPRASTREPLLAHAHSPSNIIVSKSRL